MEDKIKELQDEIKELKTEIEDKDSDVDGLEDEIHDLGCQIAELEDGPQAPSTETLEDQMKYDYFLDHFNSITLSELESLIKLKA